jgi:integrase
LARRAKKDDDRREYGDGGITTIVEGEHYLLRWYEPDPVTSKRRQHNRHFYGTRREARDEIRDIKRLVSDGKTQRQSSMTLAELADEYLEHVERANKKRTYYSYSDTLRKHILPTLGRILISKITPKQVKDLLVAKRKEPQPSKKKSPDKNEPVKYYSERTIEYIQVVVHAMFGYAIDLKYVEENPAELKKSFVTNLVDPDDPDELDGDYEDEVPIWTREQFRGFHGAGKEDYFYPAHCICATHGKRRGEVLGLKWEDVNLDTGEVRIKRAVQRFPGEGIKPCSLKGVRKSKKKRRMNSSFVLGPVMLGLLKQHWEKQQQIKEAMGDRYQDEGWIFCRPDGKPYDPKTCSTHFEKICDKAGLPHTTLHQLRHIFTTYMHDFYDMLEQIGKEMLDHTGVQVTQGYDHPTFERKKKAALLLEDIVFPGSPPSPGES